MWDLIVSVPDHCLSFYFLHENDLQLNYKNCQFVCCCCFFFFFFFCFFLLFLCFLRFVEV